MDLARLFDNITALDGVEAVWVFGPGGVAHIHRAPSGPDEARLTEAGVHVSALYAALDAQLPGLDDQLLEFDARWLLLRRAGDHVLAVIARGSANPSAVRMVTKILVRHLDAPALAALQSPAPPDTGRSDDGNPPAAQRTVRMYRGQPY